MLEPFVWIVDGIQIFLGQSSSQSSFEVYFFIIGVNPPNLPSVANNAWFSMVPTIAADPAMLPVGTKPVQWRHA